PCGPAADDGEIVRLPSRLSGTDDRDIVRWTSRQPTADDGDIIRRTSRLSAGDGEIVRRNPLGRRGRVAGHAVVTSSPGLASMRQARSTGPPLTLIRQSKQTPMP